MLTFLILVLSVLLVLIFIIWQFKVLMKYSFNYDNFKIDTKNKFLTINNKQILFKDINYITVRELEQPSISEKLLTKGALCTFNAEALLQMKDGTIEKCKFN